MRAAYAWMQPTTCSGRSAARAARKRAPADGFAKVRSVQRAEPARVDQVLRLPSVQVVLGHARLGELLPAVVLAGGERAEQRVTPDLLVAARVIDLVQLVAAAELGPDRVPQELHQLHALDRVDAAGAAQVEVEVLAQVGLLEVPRVRVQIDEPARHRLLDEVLDLD